MVKQTNKVTIRNFYKQQTVRTAVIAAVASSMAYLIALFIPFVDPYVAGIITLIAMRPTFHEAIQESWRQVVGTLLGALLGLGLAYLFPFNFLTLLIVVSFAFLIGWVLKLGDEGAIAIAVTVLIITPTVTNIEGIETRFFGVILGAVLALAASYFILPGTPATRINDKNSEHMIEINKIFSIISKKLYSNEVTIEETEKWKTQAYALVDKVIENKTEADEFILAVKWSPTVTRQDAQHSLDNVNNTHKQIMGLVKIIKSINKAVKNNIDLPHTAKINIAELMDKKANKTTSAKNDKEYTEIAKKKALSIVRKLDDTQAIIIGTSIINDIDDIN